MKHRWIARELKQPTWGPPELLKTRKCPRCGAMLGKEPAYGASIEDTAFDLFDLNHRFLYPGEENDATR